MAGTRASTRDRKPPKRYGEEETTQAPKARNTKKAPKKKAAQKKAPAKKGTTQKTIKKQPKKKAAAKPTTKARKNTAAPKATTSVPKKTAAPRATGGAPRKTSTATPTAASTRPRRHQSTTTEQEPPKDDNGEPQNVVADEEVGEAPASDLDSAEDEPAPSEKPKASKEKPTATKKEGTSSRTADQKRARQADDDEEESEDESDSKRARTEEPEKEPTAEPEGIEKPVAIEEPEVMEEPKAIEEPQAIEEPAATSQPDSKSDGEPDDFEGFSDPPEDQGTPTPERSPFMHTLYQPTDLTLGPTPTRVFSSPPPYDGPGLGEQQSPSTQVAGLGESYDDGTEGGPDGPETQIDATGVSMFAPRLPSLPAENFGDSTVFDGGVTEVRNWTELNSSNTYVEPEVNHTTSSTDTAQRPEYNVEPPQAVADPEKPVTNASRRSDGSAQGSTTAVDSTLFGDNFQPGDDHTRVESSPPPPAQVAPDTAPTYPTLAAPDAPGRLALPSQHRATDGIPPPATGNIPGLTITAPDSSTESPAISSPRLSPTHLHAPSIDVEVSIYNENGEPENTIALEHVVEAAFNEPTEIEDDGARRTASSAAPASRQSRPEPVEISDDDSSDFSGSGDEIDSGGADAVDRGPTPEEQDFVDQEYPEEGEDNSPRDADEEDGP